MQGLTDNNQVRNEIRKHMKYEIPHLPIGDLRTVEHHDEISPVQRSSNIKADIGTRAQPMHNLTRSETDE